MLGGSKMTHRSLSALVAFAALNLNAQAPARAMEQIPGAMTSWAGQTSTQDHFETRTLSEGAVLACEADNAVGTLPPSC